MDESPLNEQTALDQKASTADTGPETTDTPKTSGGRDEAHPTSKRSDSRPTAPPFDLPDLQGKTVSLAQFKGQVVFLDFWATWCPPCVVTMPLVEKLSADYKNKPVQVLGLSLDEDLSAVEAFAKDRKIPYPVLMVGGSSVARHYLARGIPHFVIVDQEGRIAKIWPGYSYGMEKRWRTVIDELLKS